MIGKNEKHVVLIDIFLSAVRLNIFTVYILKISILFLHINCLCAHLSIDVGTP